MVLPIRDYSRERRERQNERKDVSLHRVEFEMCYLGAKWSKFFDAMTEIDEMDGIDPKPLVRGPYYYLTYDPTIMEETMSGQLREVMYLARSTQLVFCRAITPAAQIVPVYRMASPHSFGCGFGQEPVVDIVQVKGSEHAD